MLLPLSKGKLPQPMGGRRTKPSNFVMLSTVRPGVLNFIPFSHEVPILQVPVGRWGWGCGCSGGWLGVCWLRMLANFFSWWGQTSKWFRFNNMVGVGWWYGRGGKVLFLILADFVFVEQILCSGLKHRREIELRNASCKVSWTVDDSFFRRLPTYRQNFHLTHLANPIHSLKCWWIDHHFVSRYMVRDYSLWKMCSNCWWWGLPGLPWLSELINGRMFQYWHRCIGIIPKMRSCGDSDKGIGETKQLHAVELFPCTCMIFHVLSTSRKSAFLYKLWKFKGHFD